MLLFLPGLFLPFTLILSSLPDPRLRMYPDEPLCGNIVNLTLHLVRVLFFFFSFLLLPQLDICINCQNARN
ncbi:hypothetical protein HOY80DRAFT_978461 [Tuber brumale]|nr:hypothetical protein HOY80DRAFT_978461 [Tuber brumale]